jgi:type IV pilus assembly protein PilV
MDMNKRTMRLKTQAGALLIEAMIAILIFSLGILAIIGMQATSLRQTADAKFRLDASFLANQIIGEMWVKKGSLSGFAADNVAIAGLPNATKTITVNGAEVTVTINWRLNGETVPHNYTTVTQIKG